MNKVGAIASEYRVFEMEVLAGVNSFDVEVREHGCTFRFDFSAVYWNSRLSTEHARLIDLFRPGQLVVDLMCGIGPFVVPGAKKLQQLIGGNNAKAMLSPGVGRGASPPIWANDLNPSSFSSLVGNLQRNKVAPLVQAHNLDARLFLWDVIRPAQLFPGGALEGIPISHAPMNLPAMAIEFLDAFVGLYRTQDNEPQPSPATVEKLLSSPLLVHVYCFSRCVEDPLSDIVPRVREALGGMEAPKATLVKHEPTVPAVSTAHERKKAQKQKAAAAAGPGTSPADASSASSSPSTSTPASSAPSAAASDHPLDQMHVRFVRNVAPNKDMFCVSFRIPREVLLAPPIWKERQKQRGRTEEGSPEPSASVSQTPAAAAQPMAVDDSAASGNSAKRKLEGAEAEQISKKSKE